MEYVNNVSESTLKSRMWEIYKYGSVRAFILVKKKKKKKKKGIYNMTSTRQNQILSLALMVCSISNTAGLSRVTKAIGAAATGTGLTSAYYFHRRKEFNEMKSGHDFWRDDYESSNTYDPKFEEMLAIGQSRI